MSEKMVAESCEECHVTFERKAGRRKHHCPECKAIRMVANITQLKNRKGAFYDNWKNRILSLPEVESK